MWNLMKALNYQIKRDKVVITTLLIGLLLPFISLAVETGFDLSGMSGGLYFAKYATEYPVVFAIVFVIVVPRISGWDATDQTMNYEILSGHSRKEIYFTRVLVSLFWSMLTGIVMMVLPQLLVTLINGWGDNVSFADVALRYLLVLFPMFRLACELILLTFLMKNCYAAMLIGWIGFDAAMIGCMLYKEFTDQALGVQLSVSNLIQLFTLENYKLLYIHGKDIPVFDSALNPSVMGSSILVSLLAGVLCLALGYAVFQKRDL